MEKHGRNIPSGAQYIALPTGHSGPWGKVMQKFTNGGEFAAAVIAAATTAGKVRLFLDVEAAGLHAAGTKPVSFSYDAFVDGVHIASYILACREGEEAARGLSDAAKASESFDFFGQNVLPKMSEMEFVPTFRDLREEAWKIWAAINAAKEVRDANWNVVAKNFVLEIWGDVIFPVETNFIAACVADGDGSRDWDGPNPLLDVASVLVGKGYNPDLPRFEAAGMDGAHQHHPSADNLASYVVLVAALRGELDAKYRV